MYSTASGTVVPPWQSNANMTNSHPAYIPVTTRSTFIGHTGFPPPPPPYVPPPPHSQAFSPIQAAAPTAPPQAAATPSNRAKTQWSPQIREYVSRCFAPEQQIKGISKEDMENKLRRIITDAASTGQLDSLNWKEMPLPQHMIQEERNRVILTPQSPNVSYASQSSVFQSAVNGQHLQQHDPVVRKRKSSELSVDNEKFKEHPWQNKKSTNSLEDRVSFAPAQEKRLKLDHGKSVSKSNASLEQRKKRFEIGHDGSNSPRKNIGHHGTSPPPEDTGPVVGTSQKLEKNYFRLTSAPNPRDVRPLPVLRQTLELLKKKWRTDNNYVYICDQFKSLRQDLTVQHIKNDFTTNVYEIHARIALEKGDLGEYNQCQTQLRALYKQNLGGHSSEFTAYRILYLIHTCNRTDMSDLLSDLTPADKSEPAVRHALNVRSALALGNYHKFFQLYLSVPNMGGYLMDMFIERERFAALARICKAYKPDVRLRFITEELAFESDEDTARFMLEHGDGSLLDQNEKDQSVRLLTGKAGQLFEQLRQTAFQHVDIKGQI